MNASAEAALVQTPGRPATLLTGLIVLALVSLAIALASGSTPLSLREILATITSQGDGVSHQILFDLRLPRALSAFAVGGLLALAGTLMQVLLRNPLGDPYVLGISGGAASAALGGMLLGAAAASLPFWAFGGALLSMLLVFGLARAAGAWNPEQLLLGGVVLASGWGALIGLILALSPNTRLPGMVFWLLGDLGNARHPLVPGLALIGGGMVAFALARSLNLLAGGENRAAALGVAVAPLRLTLFALGSLLTAVAVTVGGSIGFVGLVVPHMLRLMGAADHRLLIPFAILLGGSLLTLADTIARTIVAPQQLPVGIITALLGVPLFLYLLYRRQP